MDGMSPDTAFTAATQVDELALEAEDFEAQEALKAIAALLESKTRK